MLWSQTKAMIQFQISQQLIVLIPIKLILFTKVYKSIQWCIYYFDCWLCEEGCKE